MKATGDVFFTSMYSSEGANHYTIKTNQSAKLFPHIYSTRTIKTLSFEHYFHTLYKEKLETRCQAMRKQISRVKDLLHVLEQKNRLLSADRFRISSFIDGQFCCQFDKKLRDCTFY